MDGMKELYVVYSRALYPRGTDRVEPVVIYTTAEAADSVLQNAPHSHVVRMREVDPTRDALVAFALDVLREHRNDGEPGDVDGGWCEDTAIRHGLLKHVPVAAPCGEGCKCLEYDGEDGICLRPVPAVAALLTTPTNAEGGRDG